MKNRRSAPPLLARACSLPLALAAAWALILLGGCSDGSGPGPREAGSAADASGQRTETGAGSGATGAPCTQGPDCAGKVCIQDVVFFGHTVTFPQGYCSKKCTASADCGGKDYCQSFTDAAGAEVARYCLNACSASSPCRSGYICSSSGYCMPQEAP